MARRKGIMRLMLMVVIFLALGVLPASVQASAPYVFHDLGTLGGSESSAQAINNIGQVAGSATTSSGQTHAFLYPYPGGPMQDLGTLGGDSYANGINDQGQVVGCFWIGGQLHPFLYSYPGGPMEDLGTFGTGYWFNSAYAINNSGLVVGLSGVAGAWCHAFSYQYPGGPMQDLNNLANIGPTREGYAYDVNNSGQAVGWYFGTWGEQYHAFLYQCPDGPWKDLVIDHRV
ncbi:MAG: hypothetical protein KKA28_20060 [Planctomycetes bacterium]|nr:hypothetical protein [Planctomycetota bacterium]MBU4353819.1 hypothetical protein [Pseudomonadota bacterium]MCG2774037.1 hypothetical protein [Desulfobacterales bacterium]